MQQGLEAFAELNEKMISGNSHEISAGDSLHIEATESLPEEATKASHGYAIGGRSLLFLLQ